MGIELSIIMPVYNAQHTLERTLASLAQLSEAARSRCELVAVNDGSTDQSASILQTMRGQLTPMAVTCIEQANQGEAAARNTALAKATGRWLFFLDADDELATDPLEIIAGHESATGIGCAVAYAHHGTMHHTRTPPRITRRNFLDRFTAENPVTVSTMLFRRDAMTSQFDVSLIELPDWLFWCENPGIFERYVAHDGPPIALIHIHGGNKSLNRRRMGKYRIAAADRIEKRYTDKLTRKQRNNLRLQRAIGHCMQHQRVPWRDVRRVPCDARLWMKFWYYWWTAGRQLARRA